MITKKIISGIEFPADNVGCLIAITDVNWTQKTVENVWYPADTKFISRIDRPLNDRISHVDTIDTSNFRRGWWHIRQPISSFCKNSAYQVAMTRIRIRKIFKSLLWKKDVTVRSAETRTSRFGGKLLQVASIGWGGGRRRRTCSAIAFLHILKNKTNNIPTFQSQSFHSRRKGRERNVTVQ
jgi:hypothetical protein